MKNLQLILASASPRRQQLLKDAGLKFNIEVREVNEKFPADMEPAKVPEFLAALKSNEFQDLKPGELVITADTIVLLENKVLGKPVNIEDAFTMLDSLSGKTHQVITGVCLKSLEKTICFSDITE